MKLVEKYKERLYNNEIQTGGYNYMNSDIPEKLLKNINITTFKKLYIQLAIALFDEGFIPLTEKDNIDILREFYKDQTKDKIILKGVERHPHQYYGYLWQEYREISELITAYTTHFYNDIIKEYGDKILYIDTDCIYHKDDLDLNYLKLEYENNTLDYFLLISMKRFVAYSNDTNLPKYYSPNHRGMIVKGYSAKDVNKTDTYIDIIKNKLRTNKINDLIND